MGVSGAISIRNTFIRGSLPRKDIHQLLREGFGSGTDKVRFRVSWFRLTAWHIGGLRQDQHQSFLALMDWIADHILERYTLGPDEIVPLIMPTARSMSDKDIGRILSSSSGVKGLVIDHCIKPAGDILPLRVDFSELPGWVYRAATASQERS